ncbi:alginate export family protein [Erythrobacter mangrovi]|uniref:Alginate export family protein n=1 Tax=Erythrobacter mangrovi TaxID=2739433 RepID=A0A7D4BBU5_9SPHN|nr:alginate export family protein [Erythrobacter mangrovi]QKG72186.1 alginate export family protein [Erythrobacter mangrovi]
MRYFLLCCAVVPATIVAPPVAAAEGDPIKFVEGVTFDPIIDLRLRVETVDQPTFVDDATALTLRGRAGFEVAKNGFSLLVEGEGTLAIVSDYNDTIPGNGLEPNPVVADPDNVELNRLQVAYKIKGFGLTAGRQRINIDNQRFVGAVGWRQNEQTFDAVRGQATIGPVSLNATYSNSQRTIFGHESPSNKFDGDIVLLNAGVKTGPANVKAFAYLIDYDTRLAFSSQTYGVLATGGFPIGKAKINVLASYAHQSDYQGNPVPFAADYFNFELGGTVAGFSLKAGYEELGSDDGAASFQTPLATLHAFNGWADLFLTTPTNGLRDYYVSASKGFKVKALPGLKVAATYHKFESDFGGVDYGEEFDASLGIKLGRVGLLAKYATYNADAFQVDTDKFWLQAEISY